MKLLIRSSAVNWSRVIPGCSSVLALLAMMLVGNSANATDVDTADGRYFSSCTVLKADGLGIYFRHSDGIARVLYEDLSDDLLAALGPLPKDDPEKSDGSIVREPQKAPPNPEEVADSSIGALQLQFWQRVTCGVPEAVTHGRPSCQMPRGRFAGVHRYSRFPCRQSAELDFLITSGILPRPAGVVTRRISHRARYHYCF